MAVLGIVVHKEGLISMTTKSSFFELDRINSNDASGSSVSLYIAIMVSSP